MCGTKIEWSWNWTKTTGIQRRRQQGFREEDNRDSEKEEGQQIKLLLTSKSFRHGPGRDGYDNGEMDGSAINRHKDYGSTTKEN